MNLFDLCVYKNLNKESGGDVDVSSLVATENKTYNAGEGKAYNPVVVNVPTPSPSLQSLTASHNGYFVPSSGYDGFSEVTVDVATPLETLSATENGTYTPSSGYEGFSEVTVDVPLPNNAYLLESQKDDVVTIQHGAEFDMPKLIASIEPQQDLHGYDSPWVGGAGKNKFDSDTVLSAFTKSNNKYVGMPTFVVDNYVISGGFKTNTRYTLSYKAYNNTSTPSNFRFVFSYTDGTEEIIGGFVDTTTEKVIVGTSAENKTILKIKRTYGNGVELTLYDIQLEEGSTATSFAPYSNICPIIGWSAVDVNVSGVNVWDEEYNVSGTGIKAKNLIRVLPNTTYYFKSPCNVAYYRYDANKNYIDSLTLDKDTSFTTISNQYYMWFDAGDNYGNTTYNNDISINYPSTDTSYHAYNGSTITIQLGDTYYGGTLDVLSGVLTVDRKTYTLTGSELWRALGTGFGTGTGLSDIGTFDQNKNIAICSHFTKYNTYNWNISNGYFNIADKYIAIRDDTNFDSVEDCVSYVTAQYNNNTPITICAKLATPQTYQLTPTEVKSLLGVNNIYADTGEVDVQIWTKEVTS
jgi:hypothetical protein